MEIEELDLTKTESSVYLTLLKEGNSLAAIIIKKLQLHRATVYDVLERLIEKGLVSYIVKDKKKYYEATPPKKFLDIIQEQKQALLAKEKKAKELVSELSKIKEKTPTSNIKVLSGKEGLKNLMTDLLTVKEFLVLGGEVQFKEYLPFYTAHWAKEREVKKIYARILTNQPTASEWAFNKYKQLPKSQHFPISTIIYTNKIAIILPEEPLKIIWIESEQTAKAYRSEFELLWSSLN